MDFGVKLSGAATEGILLRGGLDASLEVGQANIRKVDIAVVKSIPILLVTPSSISEGSLSISKAQHESIVKFYRLRCKELNIANKLDERPTVKFL